MAENRSKYAVLGALSLGPMSGYDVRTFFEQGVSHFWNESFGQIYPMLKELARDGLAVPQPAKKGSRRIVYQITPAGRRALALWLHEMPDEQPLRIEILLKLFFASEGDPDTALLHIQKFRERQGARLAVYEEVKKVTETKYAGHPNLANWLMTLSYGAHVTRALLAWCDESLATVKKDSRRKRKKAR